MTKLVAIACGGTDFLAALNWSWHNDHAITPIDVRLPIEQQRDQINRLGPDFVWEQGDQEPRTNKRQVHPIELGPDDALVIETGGTGGTPKQVVHTQTSLKASADATNFALGATRLDHWLACLPLPTLVV